MQFMVYDKTAPVFKVPDVKLKVQPHCFSDIPQIVVHA